MHIKICGITNLDDARVALAAGADLLGFNFYRPSPRCVAPAHAAHIIATLRAEYAAFKVVGVFVNESLERVRAIRQQCALDGVQLHGDESAEYVRALGEHAYKALRPQTASEAKALVEQYSTSPPAPLPDGEGWGEVELPHFLLDTSHPQLYGGTGATGDWALARDIAAQHP
ncbi:MAG: phosphoribosylanthranilate isomerase, partial [Chloroflexi bacterium]|nr:phosphoribosylanthranilate isomerase [Chloroflexota bacterium]